MNTTWNEPPPFDEDLPQGDQGLGDDKSTDNTELIQALLRENDRGAAEIFKMLRVGVWIYDHGTRSWRRYGDGIWRADGQTEVLEDLQNVIVAAGHKAAEALEKSLQSVAGGAGHAAKGGADLRKLAQRVMSVKVTANVLANAAALDGMRAAGDVFDCNPGILVIENGVIDFATGAVREHRREDMATMKAAFTYDPQAECPRFDRFIEEVSCGDPDLAAFVLQLVAYSLTGFTDIDIMPFHYGDGLNGKSVLISLLERLLGPHFARVNFDVLSDGRTGTPPEYAKAGFRGRRLVVASEIGSDRRLEAHVIKDLVGGDTMTGRQPYERSVTFRPTHKLWLAGNHKPIVRDQDHGFWRRMKLVPWRARFDGREEVRSELIAAMAAENPGILNRLLAAWNVIRDRGIVVPKAVEEATGIYRNDEDQIRRFVAEMLVPSADGRIATTQVHTGYLGWCRVQGELPVSLTARKFVPQLRRLGLHVEPGRSNALFVRGMVLPGEDGEDGGVFPEDF